MKQIAEMLPATPTGIGRPITDRTAWDNLAKLESFKKLVRSAEALLARPIPPSPDDLFLEFSKTGNRTRWEAVANQRRGRIRTLALAECVENKGRFIKPLAESIAALCEERTWVMPAHDRKLANFNGKETEIDLGSSMLAWELATADYLLGDKLDPATRKLLRENLRKRILDPFEAMIDGKIAKNWWLTTTNNWNAVCLAGVVGTALPVLESRDQRAKFIAAAEAYSKNFLSGFGADGYCSEGLGYWNYGFGHYALLAETLWQATGGKLDLLALEEARQPALFGARIEIMNGVYPALADCAVGTAPDRRLMAHLASRFDLGRDFAPDAPSSEGILAASLLYSFPNSASIRERPAFKRAGGLPARTWFDESGILICRPGPSATCKLAVTLKGGHNAEHHNHNDVGTFIVVAGQSAVLLDPGPEVYTARTFSDKRYDSKLLNSWGHPVPVVAGQLQATGKAAHAEVVKTEFTDAADTLVLDIKSCYPTVKQLKTLTRTFVYSRDAAGSLTVTDEVEFDSPQDFATALITLGDWKKTPAGDLVISDGKDSLLVVIKVDGAEFELTSEQIKEDVRTKTPPTRIGINLKKPVARATVTTTITGSQ